MCGGISRLTKHTIAAALVVAISAGGAAASVTERPTGAGEARARAELLRQSELGAGWKVSAPAPKNAPALTCGVFHPGVSGVTEQGAAASPTFAQTSSGPFLGQVSHVYASADQGLAVWRRIALPGLGRCAEQSLDHGGGHGVSLRATGLRPLSLVGLAARVWAYRVTGVASAASESVPVYLDVIVLGHGTGISQISLSSFLAPVTARLELRLARAVAQRMRAGQ